jgi:hypothetical protein
MLAFHNAQPSITAGVLISDRYQFWVEEKDTRDITIKRSENGDPRLMSWIWLHPKKDERAHNPDEMAKGIFMADAVAALEHEIVKTLGSPRLLTVQVETLELKTSAHSR